jgi:aspartyl-tRNA(Asn)/glutamyl-tRNA(Gln) amidotransferase subunit C
MAITREDVARIAELARLEIPEDHVERTCRELSEVLAFVATLDRLDLEGLEPTTFATAGLPLRADEPDGRTLGAEAALAMAPAAEHGYFLVPPIVENLNP